MQESVLVIRVALFILELTPLPGGLACGSLSWEEWNASSLLRTSPVLQQPGLGMIYGDGGIARE